MTGRPNSGITVVLLLAIAATGWTHAPRENPDGPESSSALGELRLGLGAMEEGDFDTALVHYGRALEIAKVDELQFQARLGMGSAYAAKGRLDEAAAAYRAALAIKPDHAATLYSLGLVTKDQGRYGEAAALFANAAARDPLFGEALVQLGVVYEHLGRHEDAVEACRRAMSVLDDDEAALLCVGVAYYHMARYDEATEIFENVVENNPANARAHYGLGLSRLYAGDRDGAIAEVGELNELDSDLAHDLYEKIFPP